MGQFGAIPTTVTPCHVRQHLFDRSGSNVCFWVVKYDRNLIGTYTDNHVISVYSILFMLYVWWINEMSTINGISTRVLKWHNDLPCFLYFPWLTIMYRVHRRHDLIRALCYFCPSTLTLQWHHNGRDGVSNHQPHHCLLNHLFWCRSKIT